MCITKQQGPSCRFSNCVTIKKQNPRHLPFCMLGISSVDSTAKVSNFVVICMRRAETHLREWYVFNTTNPTGIYQRNRHPLIISRSAFPSKIKQSLALDASPQVQSLNELTEYQINFSLIVRNKFRRQHPIYSHHNFWEAHSWNGTWRDRAMFQAREEMDWAKLFPIQRHEYFIRTDLVPNVIRQRQHG